MIGIGIFSIPTNQPGGGAVVPLVRGWITRKAEGAPRAVASALCAVAVLAGAGVTLGMFALGTSATKMFM